MLTAVKIYQRGRDNGALVESDNALLPAHDDVLTSSDAEVSQGGNDNGTLALSDDTPDDNTLVSSDLRVHQGRNDDGDPFLSAVQVCQCGNYYGALVSSGDVLQPY